MSKQIKLGFDKFASVSTDTDQVLIDVKGNLLRDKDGNFLYTETTNTPESFFGQRNATSIHVNNVGTPTVTDGGSISIREVFADSSEVSSSLLGVPRAQTQQTLLSDVSIYGLDANTWEFYRSPAPNRNTTEWASRINKNYGRRYEPRLGEHAEEQALALEMFPIPWSYPYGPRFQQLGGYYNPTLFILYRNFIRLGNALYDYYEQNGRRLFAETHFLMPGVAVDDGFDVIYGEENTERVFQNIEQWTMTWMDIRDNNLENPLGVGGLLNAAFINSTFSDALPFDFSQTQPGYSSTGYRYCQLQSKEAFRYQPGAISGFTFGIKLNSDPTKRENVLEWGCANDTDQLMFQVKGLQFSIVRRSTVPLTERNLELAGFNPIDQRPISAPNPFERQNNASTTTDIGITAPATITLYELAIPSDKFNGDPLDGTGKSGYNISFNEVTMYKIEYSWYGAIGAKFYAYIPVSNDDARWVLIHTLIIENTLDYPSLQNPFMHFRYAIYLSDTSSLREPLYLYKYGASYYIDGDDKGTYGYNSYKLSDPKNITSANSIPLIGFQPKSSILNRDGIGITNQKNFFVESISMASDKNSRIDFLECEGCPGGHGHFYATALQNGQRSLPDQFRITADGELVFVDDALGTKFFSASDNNKKIIGPGVFSSYVFSKEDDNTAMQIRRRMGTSTMNNPIDNVSFDANDKSIVNRVETNMIGYEFTGRLSGYDDIIASTTVISKPNIKVQFLNNIRTESTGQWTEFRIGITNKKPELVTPVGETVEVLLFDGEPLNLDNEISGELAQFQAGKNIQGADVGEGDGRYGNAMFQDPRIGRPRGPSSGDCHELNFTVFDDVIKGVEYSITDPTGTLTGNNFIVFESKPVIESVTGGNIGTFNGNKFIDSGITFTGNYVQFTTQLGGTNFIAPVSAPIPVEVDIATNGIALRSIRCFGRYINFTKVFPFSATEYYLFVAMRDNARINNIVVREFDDQSTFAHTPKWIKGADCLIQEVDVQSPIATTAIRERLTETEYIGTDGRFNMGGITFSGNIPANFDEKRRNDSVKFDDQLELPLRPSIIKTSFYIGANKTETINMSHVFDTDKYKISKGSFNNKYYYVSAIVTDPGQTGTIQINISGKEQ